MRYLTFALGKGRLAKKTLELFEKIGITCEEMKDKDSRKLIFVNEELKLRFFLAKGPDVPTYVEYGAADIGIVGEDTILEEQRKLYEVLDLGFGKCRMCVCGPQSAAELLKHQEQIRVATKYPHIAKDYFYNKKHQTVDRQTERFDRAGTDRRTFRCDRRYCGDRFHTSRKRSGRTRRSMPVIYLSGSQPGEHAYGK